MASLGVGGSRSSMASNTAWCCRITSLEAVVAGDGRADRERGRQGRADDGADGLQERIAGRLEDSLMKRQVCFGEALPVGLALVHRLRAPLCMVLSCSGVRRRAAVAQASGSRVCRISNSQPRKLASTPSLQMPLQNVGIEHVPVLAIQNLGADLGLRLDQALAARVFRASRKRRARDAEDAPSVPRRPAGCCRSESGPA